jgi:RNA polymerase sigma factor (sigma-70 family)
VARKCREVDVSGYVDRIGYFYGVARNVLHEWLRDARRESTRREALKQELTGLPNPDPQSWKRKEVVHRCLELCMTKLTHRARGLIVRYYGEERAAIRYREKLADEFGKSANALRIEVHRIRKTLRRCVLGCMHPESDEAGPRRLPFRG